MEKKATYLLLFLILTLSANGKIPGKDVVKPHYGIASQHFFTGTGHGSALSFGASILNGRKDLEAGLIYNDREGKISGINAKYRIHLGNKESIMNNSRFADPYFSYNLIYQKSTSYAADIIDVGEQTIELPDSKPGLIATFGHYFGMGLQLKIFNKFYADATLGFGVYQGSLDKLNPPDSFGFHKENFGFTYNYNIGFGYRFK